MSLFKNKAALPDEQRKWNKMWELWSEEQICSPYAELMTYQSEVNNGGHCQYFGNLENIGDLRKEISALETVLPDKHKNNLRLAYEAYLKLEEAWDSEQAEETLEQCDAVFYENEEEINRILTAFAANIKL